MGAASPEMAVEGRIGPGRLVLVVGPSGAGKDSLIRAAREALAGDARFVFPRRFVTRPASGDEDNAELTHAAFEELRRADGFAVSWTAHDHGYGLPKEIEQDVALGRTVVCNVSRSVVGQLRGCYANVVVVEVTAPADVLERRLQARGRATDGSLAGRLGRAAADRRQFKPDVTVANAGSLDAAASAFLAALR